MSFRNTGAYGGNWPRQYPRVVVSNDGGSTGLDAGKASRISGINDNEISGVLFKHTMPDGTEVIVEKHINTFDGVEQPPIFKSAVDGVVIDGVDHTNTVPYLPPHEYRQTRHENGTVTGAGSIPGGWLSLSMVNIGPVDPSLPDVVDIGTDTNIEKGGGYQFGNGVDTNPDQMPYDARQSRIRYVATYPA